MMVRCSVTTSEEINLRSMLMAMWRHLEGGECVAQVIGRAVSEKVLELIGLPGHEHPRLGDRRVLGASGGGLREEWAGSCVLDIYTGSGGLS